jgi:hypothetical protein
LKQQLNPDNNKSSPTHYLLFPLPSGSKIGSTSHTADGCFRDIYEKLQVNTRSGVVAKALKEGLV